MSKYFAIIQARMGSSRFPGKVMQPITSYKSVIEFLVKRLSRSKRIDRIVLAIPYTPENDVLAEEAIRLEIDHIRGEEDDLINRVLSYFYSYNSIYKDGQPDYDSQDVIVDITSDCPLVCPYMIDYGINLFDRYDCDYVSNIMTRSWPDGFDFQIYRPALLFEAGKLVRDKHREHTGWNIINYNSSLVAKYGRGLKMINVGATSHLYFHPEWGLTLDTKEDLSLIEIIDRQLTLKGYQDNSYSAKSIITYINNYPGILNINKDIKRNIPGV